MARLHAHTLDYHGHFITSETEEKDFLEKILPGVWHIVGLPWGI